VTRTTVWFVRPPHFIGTEQVSEFRSSGSGTLLDLAPSRRTRLELTVSPGHSSLGLWVPGDLRERTPVLDDRVALDL